MPINKFALNFNAYFVHFCQPFDVRSEPPAEYKR